MVLIALLPISASLPDGVPLKILQKYQLQTSSILQKCLKTIFEFLRVPSQEGIVLKCPDGLLQRCYPIVCAWCADHEEKVNIRFMSQTRRNTANQNLVAKSNRPEDELLC